MTSLQTNASSTVDRETDLGQSDYLISSVVNKNLEMIFDK